MALDVRVADYQYDFIYGMGGVKCMLGGYGAGKSYAMAYQMLNYMMKYPSAPGLIMSIKMSILFKTIIDPFFEVLRRHKIAYRKNEQMKIIYVSLLPGKETEIYWETFSNYSELVAINVAWAVIDEIDTSPYAHEVWEKVLGRVRIGRETDIAIGSTPEGYYFTHDFFSPDGEFYNPKDGYKYVSVDSRRNRHVSRDSLMKRLSIYTPEQVASYVRGEWANISYSTVFYEFNRERHVLHPSVIQNWNPQSLQVNLIVGMDFNRTFMPAVIYYRQDGTLYGVDEIVLQGTADTRSMINALKTRYPKCRFTIYPDSSSRNESTSNAGDTDLKQLQQAFGYENVICKLNPLVEDRYSIMNYALKDGRVYYLPACKYMIKDLEKVVRDKTGRINKRALEAQKLTHASDAGTYPVYHLFKHIYADLLRDELYAV